MHSPDLPRTKSSSFKNICNIEETTKKKNPNGDLVFIGFNWQCNTLAIQIFKEIEHLSLSNFIM